MRCIHCVRSPIRVWRNRARERHWRTCSGGIHASGNRPSASSSRSQRASSRSVLARRLRPRNARVSTGSARCATAPAATSASQTNSQPVHASTATSISPAGEALHPARHGRRRRVDPAARHLTRIGVQRVEGDLRSMHIKPGYDRHQGLLYSSGIATTRESLAPSGGGPSSCHLCAGSGSSRAPTSCLCSGCSGSRHSGASVGHRQASTSPTSLGTPTFAATAGAECRKRIP